MISRHVNVPSGHDTVLRMLLIAPPMGLADFYDKKIQWP